MASLQEHNSHQRRYPPTPMDPVTYLSQGKFHRSILCHTTQCRVSFALIGDWTEQHHFYYPSSPSSSTAADNYQKPLLLYVLPSGCSRYIGMQLDGLAIQYGLRMLAIDRPGAGSTPLCQGKARMKTSTQQTLSVLESIGYGSSNISIFAHSVGWLYAVDLITERPSLFGSASRMAFCSPFVPTHCSGNILLSLLPRSIVQLAPTAFPLIQSCSNGINWSFGVLQDLGLKANQTGNATQSEHMLKKKERTRQKSRARCPIARFHPPYEEHLSLGLEAWNNVTVREPVLHPKTCKEIPDGLSLLLEYFAMEGGLKAATEDFLFCLGKVQGKSNLELEEWMKVKVERMSEIIEAAQSNLSRVSSLIVIHAEKDFLIPSKGQEYLDSLFLQANMKAEQWIMADGGHDAPIGSKEVMADVLNYLGK